MGNKQQYNLKRYDKIIKKPIQNLDKNDVVTFEYGDDNNWVNVMITDYKLLPKESPEAKSQWLEISYKDLWGYTNKCYSSIYTENDYLMDVIGKAYEIKQEKNNDGGREM